MNKSWRSAWCRTAERSDPADSETTKEAPHAEYVLHWPGCSQENDQLLREGRQRPHSLPGINSRHPTGPGSVDENTSAAVDGGDGTDLPITSADLGAGSGPRGAI